MTVILLAAEGLVVARGGRQLLDHVSLALNRGDRIVLAGPNGSGKSLLVRVLAALERPDGGRVIPGVGTKIGVLLDHGGLVSGLTVAENLALPLVRARIKNARVLDRVGWAIARFDLVAWEHAPAESLTRGIAVRAQIARAALLEPDVLLCDAPLDALDASAAAELERMIMRFADTGGGAVLMATNNPARAASFGRQVWRIDQGRLHQQGGTEI
jgi:ABC-type sulfate/molybdate transport systems ATPase subunit